jgi:hypothetical protein
MVATAQSGTRVNYGFSANNLCYPDVVADMTKKMLSQALQATAVVADVNPWG